MSTISSSGSSTVGSLPLTSPRPPVLVGAGVAAATLLLAVRDPHRSGSYGFCPIHLLTGLDCPGCGALRAVHDLTRLDLLAALHSNLLLVLAAPLAVVVWAFWLRRALLTRRGQPPGQLPSARTLHVVLLASVVLAFAFAIWRNSPWGASFYA